MNAKHLLNLLNKDVHPYGKVADFVKRDENDKKVYNAFQMYKNENHLVFKIFEDENVYRYDEKNDRFIFFKNLNENKEVFLSSNILKKESVLENIKSEYYSSPFCSLPDEKPIMPDDDIEFDEDDEQFDEKFRIYKLNVDIYNTKIYLYNINMNILMEEFHEDLKKEFNVENNPKEEMLFNLSVENYEHDYFKIYEHYKKYVELIK